VVRMFSSSSNLMYISIKFSINQARCIFLKTEFPNPEKGKIEHINQFALFRRIFF